MTIAAIHPLSAGLRVVATHIAPPLPPTLDKAVGAIWRSELDRHPRLFNGQIFTADAITPTLITGHWTEYRRLVAQLRSPELHAALGIRSLAVSGLLHGPSGVLFGRRESKAIYHPGLWQLPPAGSVDHGAASPDGSVDLVRQFQAEAEQELGLDPDDLGPAMPICAVEHARSHVIDIGLAAAISLSLSELERRQATCRDAEYQALAMVPRPDLASYLEATADQLVPSAPVFIDHWLATSSATPA